MLHHEATIHQRGHQLRRLVGAHLVTDETVAFTLAQRDPARRRAAFWISGLGLARDADLLFHDGQYTLEEYESRLGGGHSTPEHAVTLAVRAGARRLVLFHHDPTHTDDQLEAMLAEAESLAADASLQVELAREGAVYGLP